MVSEDDFALAEAFQFAHDLRDHLVDPLRLDRALAQRDLHRAQQLVAVERHAPAVALDDDQFAQLHPLESGEAEIAGRQTRRRRMTEEFSVGRESFTWVSRLAQLGQRIPLSPS